MHDATGAKALAQGKKTSELFLPFRNGTAYRPRFDI